MIDRIFVCLLFVISVLFWGSSYADESNLPPIQALLVTGGCCHDYDRQKLILTRGISARADVRWTVMQQGGKTTDTAIPLYNDPNWADGFDIVVHNECFSNVTDKAFVDRILAPHQKGTPAILIHCAMHCYRVADDRWFEFVGMQSPGHGSHYSYSVQNLKPDHPIMQGFGEAFVAPQGELYHSMKIFDTATPLAQANRQSDGTPQLCIWTNDYHGTKVFATTIGHYNETMVDPKYLDVLTRGLLWAVDRDPGKDFTSTDEATNNEIKQLASVAVQKVEAVLLPQNCCGAGNLAYKKLVTVKSEQQGHFAKHLTDGLLDTRWCASGPQRNEWVTVDLEEAHYVRAIRLHWERPTGTAYRYTVESSNDHENWKQIVDASSNRERGGARAHDVDAPETRYLRVTFLGARGGLWGSLWELEASEGELPELPKIVTAATGSAATVDDVKAPAGFNATMFASPPEVNYPVCLTAAATGEVFVGIDEQGSLGKEEGRGRVVRCIDTDGDGVADQINEFAKMDHPRGLIYDAGTLWVLHPPYLSVYRDVDGDGTADESQVLIEGISTNEVGKRGADHTTNGIRMGIDGWVYIAVGDYGFNKAVAKDGTTLSKRGGGVVRIRPDGTEMEIFSWGQRNIVDVAIDPLMNVFTRDNTNDGGGWDIRLSHVMQTAHYGYPSLYKNFTEETMPPLADYGGGSGCGAMFFQDSRWPDRFNNLVLTCDWGRSEVFSHHLPANGPTFDAQQDTFLKIPRPTDIDADASGRLYVSSWKNGNFSYEGPNVGFVTQITPVDFLPKPVRRSADLSDDELVEGLSSPSAVYRQHCQLEIMRRFGDALCDPITRIILVEEPSETRKASPSVTTSVKLVILAMDPGASLFGRVAAIYTLKQLVHERSHSILLKLIEDPLVGEHAIRAITDRKSELNGLSVSPFIEALSNSNPRVRAAALVAIGRLAKPGDRATTAAAILPLSVRTAIPATEGDAWRVPDADRVIPHLAVQTLVKLAAIDECLAAIHGPYRNGALWALKYMHDEKTVSGLFQLLSTNRDDSLRREVLTTLIRLYYREGEFTEDSPKWWGTRPDTTGPYYDRQTWSESERIAEAIKVALTEADESLAKHIRVQLKRHVVKLGGFDDSNLGLDEPQIAIELPKIDPANPNQIANLEFGAVVSRAMQSNGDALAGKELFKTQSCVNCHTFANGQNPKGPHLVDIGKRYAKRELIESIVDPSKKIAQGFDTWSFMTADGKVENGFVVLESAETVTIRKNDGLSIEIPQSEIEERFQQEISMMPKGIVGNLIPEQLADLIAYLQSLH